ncbi:MAG: hypothetical protein AB1782_17870, partial [Cyanobacteriota bacterium]
MITYWLITIFVVIIIWGTGFLALAIFKPLISEPKKLILAPLSWFTGLFVVAVFSYIVFFLSLFGLPYNYIYTIMLIFCFLLLFRIPIYNNIKTSKIDFSEFKIFNIKTDFHDLWVPVIALLCLLPYSVFTVNAVKPAWAWDAFMIWSFKAKLLFYNILDLSLLTNPSYSYAHLDYPLFVPLVESFAAQFIGVFDERFFQIIFSITFLNFCMMIFGVARTYIKGPFSAYVVLPFIAAPVMILNYVGAYVDCVIAAYHLIAVFYLYQFLQGEKVEYKYLIPAGIAMASLFMIKNEGSLINLTLFIISVITAVLFIKDYKKRVKYLIYMFLFALVFHLPWVIITKTLGITNRFISVDILNSTNWMEQLSEIPTIISFLFFENLFKIEFWGAIFFIYIVFVAVGIITREYFNTVFFVGAFILNISGVILTYVISPHDVVVHMTSSFDRVVLSLLPLVICY